MPTLVIWVDGEDPREVPVKSSKPFTVGRSSVCTVKIAARGVSKVHARFTPTDDGFRVEDADSKNGIAVNGSRVDASPLVAGDEIQLGASVVIHWEFERRKGGSVDPDDEGKLDPGTLWRRNEEELSEFEDLDDNELEESGELEELEKDDDLEDSAPQHHTRRFRRPTEMAFADDDDEMPPTLPPQVKIRKIGETAEDAARRERRSKEKAASREKTRKAAAKAPRKPSKRKREDGKPRPRQAAAAEANLEDSFIDPTLIEPEKKPRKKRKKAPAPPPPPEELEDSFVDPSLVAEDSLGLEPVDDLPPRPARRKTTDRRKRGKTTRRRKR